MKLPALLFAACTVTAAHAEPPRVLADIAPVQSLAATVMGELGTPDMLLPQRNDPHRFQLRPSQALALAEADLIVWVGPALTPGLATAIEDAPGEHLILLTSDERHSAAEMDQSGTRDADDNGANAHRSGVEEDDHTGAESGTHEGLHHDAHAWLNPDVASQWLGLIAAGLAEMDPENAVQYRLNATTAQLRLAIMSAEIDAQMATLQDRQIVVLHDAYDAFADRFGITVVGALAESDAQAPSAKRMTEVDRLLESGHVQCWFGEEGKDDRLLRAVTHNTVTRGATLDPTGMNFAPGPNLYEALIRQLADQIHGCLSGAEN